MGFFAVVLSDADRGLVVRALRRHQRDETDPVESSEAGRIAASFENPTQPPAAGRGVQ